MPTFNNPYNFLPALPRRNMPKGLRDGRPAGHHRWHDELWNGEIAVTMTAVTPLLLMRDREREGVDPHRHLEVATSTGSDGTDVVDLAPTQIKGMLRTIYEAVTNSRFGVFAHDAVLGYRSEVESAQGLRPAIVHPDRQVELLGELSDSHHTASAAVVVPAWDNQNETNRTCLLPTGFAHGDEVDAVITFSTTSPSWETVSLHARDQAPTPGTDEHVVRGRLHVTGPTTENKRAERLFVTRVVAGELHQADSTTLPEEQSTALTDGLDTLIKHQREIHRFAKQDEVWADKDPWEYKGSEPGRTAWSRHLYTVADCDRTLPPWLGSDSTVPPPPNQVLTCWAEETTRLRPVMVSRLRYDTPPGQLLDESLHPAKRIDKLSPADRLFGWILSGNGAAAQRPDETAHRGQLRVVRVETPKTSDSVEKLVELTIPPLATPKPGRFYLSPHNSAGRGPKRSGLFNKQHQQLSGRKVYPHHRGLEGIDLAALRKAFGYRPPADPKTKKVRVERDTQNATLHGWVRPGAQFQFVLQVTDVHQLELGALLWLLDPARAGSEDGPARHRIGMGKPLGFGSVELSINPGATWFCTGEAMRQRLLKLTAAPDRVEPGPTVSEYAEMFAGEFEEAVEHDYPQVLEAVRRALSGFAKTPVVSYPRLKGVRVPAPGYSWFVQNEKQKSPQWLPALGAEPLTEYDADESKPT